MTARSRRAQRAGPADGVRALPASPGRLTRSADCRRTLSPKPPNSDAFKGFRVAGH